MMKFLVQGIRILIYVKYENSPANNHVLILEELQSYRGFSIVHKADPSFSKVHSNSYCCAMLFDPRMKMTSLESRFELNTIEVFYVTSFIYSKVHYSQYCCAVLLFLSV